MWTLLQWVATIVELHGPGQWPQPLPLSQEFLLSFFLKSETEAEEAAMLMPRYKLTSQNCGVNGSNRGWRGSPTTPSSSGRFGRTSNSQRYVCIRQESRMVNCSQILQVLYVEEERLLGEFKKVCGQILNGPLQIPLLSAGQGCPHHGLHGRWVLWGDEGHLRLPRWEVDGGEEQAAALLLGQPRSGDCSEQGHHDNQVEEGRSIHNIPTELASGLRTRTMQTLTWNRWIFWIQRKGLWNVTTCSTSTFHGFEYYLQVRASTPLREMEPTPLDRHRLIHWIMRMIGSVFSGQSHENHHL